MITKYFNVTACYVPYRPALLRMKPLTIVCNAEEILPQADFGEKLHKKHSKK